MVIFDTIEYSLRKKPFSLCFALFYQIRIREDILFNSLCLFFHLLLLRIVSCVIVNISLMLLLASIIFSDFLYLKPTITTTTTINNLK